MVPPLIRGLYVLCRPAPAHTLFLSQDGLPHSHPLRKQPVPSQSHRPNCLTLFAPVTELPRDETCLAFLLPTLLSGDMSTVSQWPSPTVSIEPSGQEIDLEIGVDGHEKVHLHLHTVDTRIKSPRRVTARFSGNSKGPSESSKDGASTVSGKQLFP